VRATVFAVGTPRNPFALSAAREAGGVDAPAIGDESLSTPACGLRSGRTDEVLSRVSAASVEAASAAMLVLAHAAVALADRD